MVVDINKIRQGCSKNQSNPDPELHAQVEELYRELGFEKTNLRYNLQKRMNLSRGTPYQFNAFCFEEDKSGGFIPKDQWRLRSERERAVFGKFKNKFGDQPAQGGIRMVPEANFGWCSSSPNTIGKMVPELKTNGIRTGNDVNGCDFVNGVSSRFKMDDTVSTPVSISASVTPSVIPIQQVEVLSEVITPPTITAVPIISPKTHDQPIREKLTKGNAVIYDKTTELFIPIEDSKIDRNTIKSAISSELQDLTAKLNANKKSKQAQGLISYVVKKFDNNQRKYVMEDTILLTSCTRDNKMGFCAPIGLTENVKSILKQYDIDLTVDDQRVSPEPHPFELNKTVMVDGKERPLVLRDYQAKIVKDAQDKKMGIVEVATGGGKTLIATAMIGAIGQNTAFVVPNNSLFYNAKSQIGSYVDPSKVNIGQVGGMNVDYKDEPGKTNINIVSLPLAGLAISNPGRIDPKKREVVLKTLSNANMIIFDETHHISADTYKEVAKFSSAKYRFGLSATPFRDDGKTLDITAGVGNILKDPIRAKDLIKSGKLAEPQFLIVNNAKINPESHAEMLNNLADPSCEINPNTNMYKNTKEGRNWPIGPGGTKHPTEFRYIEKATVECNNKRNERLVDIVKKLDGYDKTKVLFVNSVKHAEKLQNALEKEGIYTEILTGDTERDINKELLTQEEIDAQDEEEKEFNKKRVILFDKMKKGDLRTIIATDKIMGEGVDIPAIDSLILADMRRSPTAAMQMVGRAIRMKEGKKNAIIFDFNDNADYLDNWMESRHTVWGNENYPMTHLEYENVDQKLVELIGVSKSDITVKSLQDRKKIEQKQQQFKYENMLLPELKATAKAKGVKGITGMKKHELVSRLMLLP